MPSIKFSNVYPKMWGQTNGKLLADYIIEPKDLTPEFLEYDTKDMNNNYFPLNKNIRHILLVLLGNKTVVFSTARPFSQEKYVYYTKNIGTVFDFVLVDAPKKDDKNQQRLM